MYVCNVQYIFSQGSWRIYRNKLFFKFLWRVLNAFVSRTTRIQIISWLRKLWRRHPFCSLSLFEYPFGQPRLYLSCLYTLTTWSYFYIFTYFTYFFHYSFYIIYWKNKIYLHLRDIIMITATIIAIISILLSQYHLNNVIYYYLYQYNYLDIIIYTIIG